MGGMALWCRQTDTNRVDTSRKDCDTAKASRNANQKKNTKVVGNRTRLRVQAHISGKTLAFTEGLGEATRRRGSESKPRSTETHSWADGLPVRWTVTPNILSKTTVLSKLASGKMGFMSTGSINALMKPIECIDIS